MKSYTFKIVAIICSILIFSMTILSCEKKEIETEGERQERLEKTVADKLESQRIKKMKKCRESATTIAETKVDSILLAEAKLLTNDTNTRPVKPTKPNAPTVNPPKDNTPVKPLFNKGSDLIE